MPIKPHDASLEPAVPANSSASVTAYVAMDIGAFHAADPSAVLGLSSSSHRYDDLATQKDAWQQEIDLLRTSLAGVDGHIFLEFEVPRLGSRIDAVIVAGAAIIPIEFKVGRDRHEKADFDQAWDYALDLKNFHEASHLHPIFPILVATHAIGGDATWHPPHQDGVHPPRRTNAATLASAIQDAITCAIGTRIDANAWGRAPYRPTPTIIQAARALYARHSVQSISRSDAGAVNLSVTSSRIEEIVTTAQRERMKAIVFVTGVPGAGKTLVGLNVATRHRPKGDPTHAVYLSGNGPLVSVLREALVRDEVERVRASGRRARKGDVAQGVKAFIQNVHHFRDAGLNDPTNAPDEHVVIFDEAQRAWNRGKTSDFMRRREGRRDFDQSEPQFLIGCMDRHSDWSVIVCLVGGGQEIHDGEAGISAWLDAIAQHFHSWNVFVSPNLIDSEYDASDTIHSLSATHSVRLDDGLHLSVSMRSFRAESVSRWVKAILDGETVTARQLYGELENRYPIVVTRDLHQARAWIRHQARGTEQYGLLASSQAERLKPHAIDVRVDVNPIHYFLSPPDDTRSSWYLEDAATEFQVQGLELDWACVTWDADLRRQGATWMHHRFRGSNWVNVRADDRRRYLRNAYRDLLTRARQGMVIFVPKGDEHDLTRSPAYYDGTFNYLRSAGLESID